MESPEFPTQPCPPGEVAEKLPGRMSKSPESISSGPHTPAEVEDEVRSLENASCVLNGYVSPFPKAEEPEIKSSKVELILKKPPELALKSIANQQISVQPVSNLTKNDVKEGVQKVTSQSPRDVLNDKNVKQGVIGAQNPQGMKEKASTETKVELYMVPTRVSKSINGSNVSVNPKKSVNPPGTSTQRQIEAVPESLRFRKFNEGSKIPALDGINGVPTGGVSTHRNGCRSLVESCLQAANDLPARSVLPQTTAFITAAERRPSEVNPPLYNSRNGTDLNVPALSRYTRYDIQYRSGEIKSFFLDNNSPSSRPAPDNQQLPRELDLSVNSREKSPVLGNAFSHTETVEPLNLSCAKPSAECPEQLAEQLKIVTQQKDMLEEKIKSLSKRQREKESLEMADISLEPEHHRGRSSSFGGSTSAPSLPTPDTRGYSPPSRREFSRDPEVSWDPVFHPQASQPLYHRVSPVDHDFRQEYPSKDSLDSGVFLRPSAWIRHQSPVRNRGAAVGFPSPRGHRSPQFHGSPRERVDPLMYQVYPRGGGQYAERESPLGYSLPLPQSPSCDRQPVSEPHEEALRSNLVRYSPSTETLLHRMPGIEPAGLPLRRSTVAELLSAGTVPQQNYVQKVSPADNGTFRSSPPGEHRHHWTHDDQHVAYLTAATLPSILATRHPSPGPSLPRYHHAHMSQMLSEKHALSPPQDFARFQLPHQDQHIVHQSHRALPTDVPKLTSSPSFQRATTDLRNPAQTSPGQIYQPSRAPPATQREISDFTILRMRHGNASSSTLQPSVIRESHTSPPPATNTSFSTASRASSSPSVSPRTVISNPSTPTKPNQEVAAGPAMPNGKTGPIRSIKKRWLELHSSEEGIAPTAPNVAAPTALIVGSTTQPNVAAPSAQNVAAPTAPNVAAPSAQNAGAPPAITAERAARGGNPESSTRRQAKSGSRSRAATTRGRRSK